jgi:chloramphenicol O-acetyltransferase type A
MRHLVDLEHFERKDSILFFQTFPNPNISITSEVECTGGMDRAKKLGISFFFYYSHAMLKACNEIKEFKYRMNKQGQMFYYDTIDALAVIRTGDKGAYNTLRFPYHENRIQFAQAARRIMEEHEITSNPFFNEPECPEEDLGVFLLSAMPALSFTGISFAYQGTMDGYPLSLIGKLIRRQGREYLPIALNVNHAFIDGYHLEAYYRKVSKLLLG